MARQKQSTDKGFRKAIDGRYTGFIYYNPKTQKTTRVSASDGWPDNVYDFETALKEKGRILAKIDVELLDAKKRLDWVEKYQKFDKLFEEYEKWVKRRAPNSWKTTSTHVKNRVLYWYLDLNGLNNPEMWPRYFNKFTDWLLDEEPMKSSTGKLSRNSVNNIIKSLNSFLTFLEKEHQLGPFFRCECVQIGKNERRGLEAIYSEKEIKVIGERLGQVNEKFETFFRLLCKSGMRSNECLGLHVRSFVVGSVPKEKKGLFKRIADSGIDIYGFILLRDQPKLDRLYDKKGSVPRKPLKGRKEIDPQYNRYIPLIDQEITQELVKLRASAKMQERPGEEDKLLFGFTHLQFYRALYEILKSLELKGKDVHSTRHTFATWLTSKVEGDRSVSEDVLGHSDSEVNKRYVHLAEELEANLNLDNEEQVSELKVVKF